MSEMPFELIEGPDPMLDELKKIRELLETLATKPAQIIYQPYVVPAPPVPQPNPHAPPYPDRHRVWYSTSAEGKA